MLCGFPTKDAMDHLLAVRIWDKVMWEPTWSWARAEEGWSKGWEKIPMHNEGMDKGRTEKVAVPGGLGFATCPNVDNRTKRLPELSPKWPAFPFRKDLHPSCSNYLPPKTFVFNSLTHTLTHVFSIAICFHPNIQGRLDCLFIYALPVSKMALRQWNIEES